jgi:predicted DNA-binding transcriptional regulator AlpA
VPNNPKNSIDQAETNSPRSSGRPFLRTPAAAQYLNIGKSTLEKWRCTGEGPRYAALGSRVIIYNPDELDRYAEERLRQSTAPQEQPPDPVARRAAEQIRRGRLPASPSTGAKAEPRNGRGRPRGSKNRLRLPGV